MFRTTSGCTRKLHQYKPSCCDSLTSSSTVSSRRRLRSCKHLAIVSAAFRLHFGKRFCRNRASQAKMIPRHRENLPLVPPSIRTIPETGRCPARRASKEEEMLWQRSCLYSHHSHLGNGAFIVQCPLKNAMLGLVMTFARKSRNGTQHMTESTGRFRHYALLHSGFC